MLNQQGFNLWADDYDKTVQLSDENNQYPFAGYKQILNTVFNEVMHKEAARVLDIGFGTGVLTSKLYDSGHEVDGIDFSARMIEIAQPKMPNANLLEWDISKGLPETIREKKYDFIISTYALHHLEDEAKVEFIKQLLTLLEQDGKILIGDIAFSTREQLEQCREQNSDHWDEDEFYFVSEEIQPLLEGSSTCEFHPISHCGGVFLITKKN